MPPTGRSKLVKQHRTHPHHNDDTAPFDVPAFLDYLQAIDQYNQAVANDEHVDSSPDDPAANIRTHYYGDDCPGGHYDCDHSDDDDGDHWADKQHNPAEWGY